MGYRGSTGAMAQWPAVRGFPEYQMYGSPSENARRLRAQRASSVAPMRRYEGSRGNIGPNEVTGVMGGNWENLPPPMNDRGCPVGWNGEGDNVSARITLPAGQGPDNGSTTELIVQAPFEFAPRYVIIEGFLLDAEETGAIVGPIPAGTVFLSSARTANGPDALFNSNGAPGIDITFYDPTRFVPRDVNFPQFFNQPGLSLQLINENTASAVVPTDGRVLLNLTFWGESAHAGAPNLGNAY